MRKTYRVPYFGITTLCWLLGESIYRYQQREYICTDYIYEAAERERETSAEEIDSCCVNALRWVHGTTGNDKLTPQTCRTHAETHDNCAKYIADGMRMRSLCARVSSESLERTSQTHTLILIQTHTPIITNTASGNAMRELHTKTLCIAYAAAKSDCVDNITCIDAVHILMQLHTLAQASIYTNQTRSKWTRRPRR